MTALDYIQSHLDLPRRSIDSTIQLLSAEATIPFIARYRKDQTGNLNEVEIQKIQNLKIQFDEIEKRKKAILSAIENQKQLSQPLEEKIVASYDLQELEDLYLPYKRKRNTRAQSARDLGLEPLARALKEGKTLSPSFLERFLCPELPTSSRALELARDILAEWISEDIKVRKTLRRLFERRAAVKSVLVKAKAQDPEAQKYRQYFDWHEPLFKMPSHRLLALLRASQEGFVRMKVEVDPEEIFKTLEPLVVKPHHTHLGEMQLALKDSITRLLYPSLSTEVLGYYKRKADQAAIDIFAQNLKQLLLSAPLGEKRILALDPGYRSGCKLVCLDEKGELLHNETIYPHPPQKETTQAIKKIRSLVGAYKIEAIAIGNGTASRETEALLQKIAFERPPEVFVVSEAGASVYSASALARAEFPSYDVTVRGAVSIGRRLSDPLAELVKIDPKSIGVGQYQHDVDQSLLQQQLHHTVVGAVNSVGVNVNTASASLLQYVSGIGEKLAAALVEYRKEHGGFSSREQLLSVPRLGSKAFEQCAAFLRIPQSKHPLDNSAVHPESYPVVERIAKDLRMDLDQLIGNAPLLDSLELEKYTSEKLGILSLKDIVSELKKPGLDPRTSAKVLVFDSSIRKLEDLNEGMVLNGIVNNITAFGCFVDIGIKESGLVHISQVSDRFLSSVTEAVHLHQHVKVRVLEVDLERRRVQLSMRLKD
ncbi:Tex family protein [Planobacterium oryzisoli]|uniref:RNA-binding transcriptional accessory protein n=1 Tax=Planobacterium oryzisoli TaxID=2771435 RepID=A0A930YWD8_9FLAO|nr:Tex family protein [Planobacterium oryzisoli]MBF5027643.1 RNA-binding transcriptional accessory protein [Planobacterium oryzisoli]